MADFLYLCVLAGTIALLLYIYMKRKFNYWKSKGVKQLKPVPLFGNFGRFLLARSSQVETFRDFYNAGAGQPYVGLYRALQPVLMLRDPEIIKQIITKDFTSFPDRGIPVNEKTNPLGAHLITMKGARWKNLRIKLTPVFTSGKLKKIYPLMKECLNDLFYVLDQNVGKEVEMKDILARFTTDIIATCAFGLKCDSLRNPGCEFREHSLKFLDFGLMFFVRELIEVKLPALSRFVPNNKAAKDFFVNVVKNTISERDRQNIKRGDLLDMLIEIKKKGKIVDDLEDLKNDPFLGGAHDFTEEDMEFTDNLMVGQTFLFFVAGFETSSTAMSFCLLELSRNIDIQNKLRDEIDKVWSEYGDLTYDALAAMPYMDMVVSETLRKYPPLPILTRRCNKSYMLMPDPDSNVQVSKGTQIFIPVDAIHHDPEIYPSPDRFDPERFSAEAKASRHPYTYLPFGEGPRICIGARFGLTQTKIGIAAILRNYEVRFSERTIFPVQFKPVTFFNVMVGGNYLKLQRRSKNA